MVPPRRGAAVHETHETPTVRPIPSPCRVRLAEVQGESRPYEVMAQSNRPRSLHLDNRHGLTLLHPRVDRESICGWMPPSTPSPTIDHTGPAGEVLGRGVKVTDSPSGIPSERPASWLARSRTFLRTHPTRWWGLNEFIWIWAAVVAVVLATNIPSSIAIGTRSSATTMAGATANTVAPLLEIVPATTSGPPSPAADTGGPVIVIAERNGERAPVEMGSTSVRSYLAA